MQALYSLQVDFVNERSYEMAVSASRGLQAEELSEFQLRMLTSNRMPRLLELHTEARDGCTTLYYTITGKRMLSQGLRAQRIGMKQYYTLLLQIVELLEDSLNYMLDSERFVLKEEYIFYGHSLDDLYFTYLPIQHVEGKPSVQAELRDLASRWMQRVDDLQGGGFQELMRCLEHDTFHISELKRVLLKRLEVSATSSGICISDMRSFSPSDDQLRTGQAQPASFEWPYSTASGGASSASIEGARPSEPWLGPSADDGYRVGFRAQDEAAAAYGYKRGVGSSAAAARDDGLAASIHSGVGPAPSTQATAGADSATSTAASTGKKPLPFILGAVLAIAFLWKLYADQQEESMLLIACAGTAAALIALYAVLRSTRRGKAASSPKATVGGQVAGVRLAESPPVGGTPSFLHQAGLFDSPSATSYSGGELASAEQGVKSSLAYQELSVSLERDVRLQADQLEGEGRGVLATPEADGRTTTLTPNDATVWLGSSSQHAAKAITVLETVRSGVKETIALDKSTFTIGRQQTESDYLLDEVGVSRLHAELVKDEDGYSIKDLGSRNGTVVNGEALVPYRMHKLREGDMITIVNCDFIYKMGC
ncbi:DUF6382 domain-containing protein [Paenibacillus sp. YYML68]|uniref:DUF6382 domain-containing protein n=1 Tax=Paenibacillus sp. YYML68 TaxID=2909250 RepID=UPI0024913196|nr:DUF6382 domain-containing protein [Paenibacillus sp. YYML68]